MQRLALCYCAAALVALTKHSRIPWLIVALLVGYFVLLGPGQRLSLYGEENILSKVDRAILTPAHMYRDNGIEPEGILPEPPSPAIAKCSSLVARILLGGTQACGDVPRGDVPPTRHDHNRPVPGRLSSSPLPDCC